MDFEPFTAASTMYPWSEELEKQFTFVSRFGDLVKVFRRSLDGKTIEVPRGAVPIADFDCRDKGIPVDFISSFKSQKPEQLAVVEKSVQLLKQDKQFVIAAPTGWGKTFVGTEIAAQMGRRFLVITTKEDIIYQWVKAIQATLGLATDEIGVWRGDSVPSPKHKAVVALVHSVRKGPERYGLDAYLGFGTVVCDEVHRMAADSFSQAMWHLPSKYRIGLSATPKRKDGKDKIIKWHIGPVAVEATMQVMVPKFLVHKTSWKVPRTTDGQQIPHDIGNIALLMKPLSRSIPRNQLILKYLLAAFYKGRHIIGFSESLEHLDTITDLLIQAGIDQTDIGWYVGLPNSYYGDSKKKDEQREIREQHATRSILLATYSMASEATNLPWLDTCILMTPRGDVNQAVGRIRREYENKKPPVVVDLVDNDSWVLNEYAKSRLAWYHKLDAEVLHYAN